MVWLKPHRRAVIVVSVLTAVSIGLVVWLCTLQSNNEGLSMGDFGPQKQHDWAERLIAGLNTHDANQVPVLLVNGQLLGAQRGTVQAAVPAPGCYYELLSVKDRGEQGRGPVPGLRTENSTYRFDITVNEQCSGKTRTRVLGVVSIAEMSYWEPFYFVV